MKISIKNFRVFKEKTEFEIRPLTVLVGPNNSGKSSFTKLLLLLKNGYEKLDFTTGDHHLGSYSQALNWDLKEEGDINMVLSSEKKYSYFPDIFEEEIIYNTRNEIKSQRITNKTTGEDFLKFDLFRPEKKQQTAEEAYLNPPPIPKATISLDINYLINLIYTKDLLISCYSSVGFKNTKIKTLTLQENDLLLEKEGRLDKSNQDMYSSYSSKVNLKNYYKLYTQLTNVGKKFFWYDYYINSALVNTIDSLERDYLLYTVYVDGQNVTIDEDFKQLLRECQETFYSEYIESSYDSPIRGDFSILNILDILNMRVKIKIKKEFEKHFQNHSSIEIVETDLGRIIFTEKMFKSGDSSTSIYLGEIFSSTLIERLRSEMFIDFKTFEKTSYIPANRGKQDRIIHSSLNKQNYQLSVIFEDYTRSESLPYVLNKDPNEVLKQMLEVIGIKGEIKTKRLEDTLAIYIIKNGKEINLADYGFGYSQLLPIIISLYIHLQNLNLALSFSYYFIIEEPEANLHPALQSKLADILMIANKASNNSWKFIIETHSEYFIRKLQYLTAKQELKTENCIIHYFNSDENVTREEPKVKPIEINEEGNLTDNFGPGFYDEATRLQFELLKLNRNQSN